MLHDNARLHVAEPVKKYIKDMSWEVLPYPPYSPDIAPPSHHLFRAILNDLSLQPFKSFEDIENGSMNGLPQRAMKDG